MSCRIRVCPRSAAWILTHCCDGKLALPLCVPATIGIARETWIAAGATPRAHLAHDHRAIAAVGEPQSGLAVSSGCSSDARTGSRGKPVTYGRRERWALLCYRAKRWMGSF